MDKDLRDRLYWLNEELNEEERELLFSEQEPEEDPAFLPPPRRRGLSQAERFERKKLEQLDPMDRRSAPVVRKKGIRGYLILAGLELMGILLVIGWWLQWLI